MGKLATPILREVDQLRRAGLTEDEMAKGTGAARSTARAWLAGTRSPSGQRSDRLIELIGAGDYLSVARVISGLDRQITA